MCGRRTGQVDPRPRGLRRRARGERLFPEEGPGGVGNHPRSSLHSGRDGTVRSVRGVVRGRAAPAPLQRDHSLGVLRAHRRTSDRRSGREYQAPPGSRGCRPGLDRDIPASRRRDRAPPDRPGETLVGREIRSARAGAMPGRRAIPSLRLAPRLARSEPFLLVLPDRTDPRRRAAHRRGQVAEPHAPERALRGRSKRLPTQRRVWNALPSSWRSGINERVQDRRSSEPTPESRADESGSYAQKQHVRRLGRRIQNP